jgi:hypothetical protein
VRAVGEHLGRLAGADLADRCRLGRVGDPERSRRKKELTVESSSRWAGAITRTSNDQWQRGYLNLLDTRAGLRQAARAVEARLAVPVGATHGRVRGYADRDERFRKQQRLQHLHARLADVEDRIGRGRVSVVRGGRGLVKQRHHLEQAGLTEARWKDCWSAERLFVCADGEADKTWGNETIRVHPDEGWIELRLPRPLADLANRPHCRYRLDARVSFPHRGDEWAAQAATGAVRYDICFDPVKGRWYLDASWTTPGVEMPELDDLCGQRTVGVDLNDGHLAAWVIDPSGNPVGPPATIPLELAGLAASTRDGRLRSAVTHLLDLAAANGCASITIENLGFDDARTTGRETMGRGRRGKQFRRTVAGLPTARFRRRLAGMAANRGVAVIAVDPAYTSRWGGEHWQQPLDNQTPPSTTVTRHHAAAVVIGRRSLGHGARRRPHRRNESGVTGPHQRMGQGELPARPATNAEAVRKSGPRKAHRQTNRRHQTGPADRDPPGNQATKDRSRSPAEQHPQLFGVPRNGGSGSRLAPHPAGTVAT